VCSSPYNSLCFIVFHYKSCQDALEGGNVFSTHYMIQPDDGMPFLVYCDMDSTNGIGWVVFQRRFDGSVDFFRNWTDYQKGFGDIQGEFWLGLDKIHRLTNKGKTRLRVELEDYDGSEAYADYSTFSVGPVDSGYVLSVNFSGGPAGDSITDHHSGMKFSTPDVDNDPWRFINCAVVSNGAWWYNRCHVSNLNGQYSTEPKYGSGYARWSSWRGTQSLKETTMKLV